MKNLAVMLVHHLPFYCGWLVSILTQETEAVSKIQSREENQFLLCRKICAVGCLFYMCGLSLYRTKNIYSFINWLKHQQFIRLQKQCLNETGFIAIPSYVLYVSFEEYI